MKVNRYFVKSVLAMAIIGYLVFLFKVIILKYIPFSTFVDEMIASPIWHLLPRPLEQCNFVPFKTIKLYINSYGMINRSITINNLLGNILLFLPLGILMRINFSERVKGIVLLLAGILLSFTFEVIQYIAGVGIGDVDDVILNSLGLLIGLFIGYLMNRLLRNSMGDKEVL
jgi:glycopeptide antibiotics resistance protein